MMKNWLKLIPILLFLYPISTHAFQAPINVGDVNGANFRTQVNNAFQAVGSNSAGPTAPSSPTALQWWVNTSTNPPTFEYRSADNTAWVVLPLATQPGGTSGQLQTNNGSGGFAGTSGGGDCTFTGPSTFTCTKTGGVPFAPSATVDTTNYANITTGVVGTNHGGSGTVNPLIGILRGGNPYTGSELSGDASTSGSNAVTVKHFTLASNAGAAGFKIQNLATPGATGDALSEGHNIGSITPIPSLAATSATITTNNSTTNNSTTVNSTNNNTTHAAANDITMPEITTPAGIAGKAIIWDEASTHQLSLNSNNQGAHSIALRTGAFTNGNCVQSSVSGNLVMVADAGAPCSNFIGSAQYHHADQNVTGSTPAADTNISVAIGANQTWSFTFVIFQNTSVGSSGTTSFTPSVPVGATTIMGESCANSTSASFVSWSCGNTSTLNMITVNLTVINGSNAGNVIPQYSTSTGTRVIKAGSSVTALQVS